jgi:hypothetical protein
MGKRRIDAMQSIRPGYTNQSFGGRPQAEPKPRQQEFIELHTDETYEVISAAFKTITPALILADRFDSLSPDESESLLKVFRKFKRRYQRAKDVTPPKTSGSTESDARRQPSEGDEFRLRKRPPFTIQLPPEDFQVIAHEYKPIPPGSDDWLVKLGLPLLPDKKKG